MDYNMSGDYIPFNVIRDDLDSKLFLLEEVQRILSGNHFKLCLPWMSSSSRTNNEHTSGTISRISSMIWCSLMVATLPVTPISILYAPICYNTPYLVALDANIKI